MKTAILLDLDRTIFNTNWFWEDVFTAVEKLYGHANFIKFQAACDVTYRKYGAARLDVAARKIAADPEAIFERLERNYLYPDAAKFIAAHRDIFLLSMGEDFSQNFKLRLVGLKLPIFVISKHQKSKWIYRHCLKNGHYEIAGQTFHKLVLCDDKPSNFDAFEKLPNAQGFLVNRKPERINPSQQNLTEVHNFSEIVLQYNSL